MSIEQKDPGSIQTTNPKSRVRPVAKGEIRKNSTTTRLSDIFIAQDIKSVGAYVFERVIVPALQNLAVNTINSIARGVFLGEGAINTFNDTKRIGTGHTSYNSMYGNGGHTKTYIGTASNRARFEELNYGDYGDAQMVLDILDECIQNSGYATIADLYEASEKSCPYTGEYYGWRDLSRARIVQDGDRWWLKMPKAMEIKERR